MSHAVVNKQQTRKLREVTEIINVDKSGNAVIHTPCLWNPYDDSFYFRREIKAFEKISNRYGTSLENLYKELYIRARLLFEMYRKEIFDFYQTQKIINEYYKNPAAVISAFGLTQ